MYYAARVFFFNNLHQIRSYSENWKVNENVYTVKPVLCDLPREH
jgi:predicted S18 family serine protease